MPTGGDGGLCRQDVASGLSREDPYAPAGSIELFTRRVVELNPAASFSSAVDLVDDQVSCGRDRIAFRFLALFLFNEIQEG